jgi:hypothetical protein
MLFLRRVSPRRGLLLAHDDVADHVLVRPGGAGPVPPRSRPPRPDPAGQSRAAGALKWRRGHPLPVKWSYRSSVLVVETIGQYGREELKSAMLEARADPQFAPGTRVLFDGRLSELDVSTPDIDWRVQLMSWLQAMGFSRTCAVVVRDKGPNVVDAPGERRRRAQRDSGLRPSDARADRAVRIVPGRLRPSEGATSCDRPDRPARAWPSSSPCASGPR